MFYVYHIPKRKQWGCTANLERRLKALYNRRGYTINDVTQILTFTDIDEAADTEKELNLKYGYGWNPSRDYRVALEKSYKGGKKAAEVNVASGLVAELGKSGKGGRARQEKLRKLKELGLA
jgi:hypothetical protein